MKSDNLKNKWVRSFMCIGSILLLIALGLVQPHASEKVVQENADASLTKLQLNPLMQDGKLPDIFSNFNNLFERMEQSGCDAKPILNMKGLKNSLNKKKSELIPKQMNFFKEIQALKESGRGMEVKGKVVVGNGGGGYISGKVTAEGTGEGIMAINIDAIDQSFSIVGSTSTGTDGEYVINDLPTGNYFVYANVGSDMCYINEYYNDALPWKCGTPPIHVEAPNGEENINFSLAVGGAISGCVVDKTTAVPLAVPLANVRISLFKFGYAQWYYGSFKDAVTGPDGCYKICGLPTGSYYLYTSNDLGYIDEYYNDALPVYDDPPIKVIAPNETKDVNFELVLLQSDSYESDNTCGVAKIITPNDQSQEHTVYPADDEDWFKININGEILLIVEIEFPDFSSLNINFYESDCSTVLNGYSSIMTRTDINVFRYEFYVSPGTYYAQVNGLFQMLGPYKIRVYTAPPGKISGRVFDDANPAQGIEGVDVGIMGYAMVQTDSNGNYEISSLPEGKFLVYVWNMINSMYSPFEFYKNAPTFFSNKLQLVEVDLGATTSDINFGMPHAGTISGEVSGVGNDTTVYISAQDFIGSYNSVTITGPGKYTLSVHPEGIYKVNAQRDDNGNYQFYSNTQSRCAAEFVTPPRDDINFNFLEPGCIGGTVTDADTSVLLQNAEVEVYEVATGKPVTYNNTQENGTYKFCSLSPGTYRVKVYSSSYLSQTSVDIVLSEGGYETVDFALEKPTSPIPQTCVLVGEAQGKVGDTVTIPITLENLQNLPPHFYVPLWFDNTKLKLSDIREGDIGSCYYYYYPLVFYNEYNYFTSFAVFFDLLIPQSGTLINLAFTILSGTPGDEIPLIAGGVGKITVVECTSNADCNDGKFCNGAETCLDGICKPGENPCPGKSCDEVNDKCVTTTSSTTSTIKVSTTTTTSIPECTTYKDCEDGKFCNGAETCVNRKCRSAGNPCPNDGLFCNGSERCDEAQDKCVSSGGPCSEPTPICREEQDACVECLNNADCDNGFFCDGTETCVGGACQPGTNPCKGGEECDEANDRCLPPIVPCSISIEPESEEVTSGQTVSFTITTEGDCSTPNYEWSVESTIGSKVENGTYTAGINLNMFNASTDKVKVVDHGNGDAEAEATVTVSLCPAMQLYGEGSKEVEALRSFRDNVLSTTPEGQELIKLYYELSPVIGEMMAEDPALREELKGMIDKILPLLIK